MGFSEFPSSVHLAPAAYCLAAHRLSSVLDSPAFALLELGDLHERVLGRGVALSVVGLAFVHISDEGSRVL